MNYSFDKIIDRQGTNSEKYDNREKVFGRSDVIPLWVADSDFETPPFIMEALERRMSHPVFGYTFRTESFSRAVTGWIFRRSGWKVDDSWVDFVPGVVSGLVVAMRAFSAAGDGVVIQPPVYPPFARMVKFNGRTLLNNPLVWDGKKYVVDFDDLDAKLSAAKVFILCNPHNPTGRVFTPAELLRMGELCLKHNVMIISDEIHSDLTLKPNKHTHIASLSEEIARITVTLVAPSKTFNLAGFSTSAAITSGDVVRREFRRYMDMFHASQGNIFGAVALEAAYNNGDEWVDALNEYIAANADYVVDFLKNNIPSIKTFKPEGTYLMWLDFREWNMPHDSVFRFLVDEAGIGLNDGKFFGEEGIGFMRLNLATQLDVIKQAMAKLMSAAQVNGLA